MGAIAAIEADLGRPVLTANQALFWSALRAANAPARLEHYGPMFAVDAPTDSHPPRLPEAIPSGQ